MLAFGKKKKDADDFFEHLGSKIKHKNNNRTISNSTDKEQTAYGSYIADCTSPGATYTWTIKIKEIGKGSSVCIGIESAETMSSLEAEFHHNKATHYAYKNNGDIFYNVPIAQEMPTGYKAGDMVIMILHSIDKTIEFYCNDHQVQKCYDIEPEKYRLAVFLCGNKHSCAVKIDAFKIDDNGIQQTQDVKQLLDTIEQQKQEILRLKQEINTLTDEKKEHDVGADIMKLSIETLVGKSYMEWSSNDVIIWILWTDNGVLKEYEEILRKEILEQGVVGHHLEKISIDDIEGFGVSKVSHQKSLVSQIGLLIRNSYNNNNNSQKVVRIDSRLSQKGRDSKGSEGGVTYF